MKKRSLLITLLSLILTFSVSIGLTTTKAYAEETPVEYSMGDANLDGNVNTRDVVLIKQSIVGLTELNDKQKVFADVYADGQINTRDVVLIQQSIVGMDVDLGTHEHSFENGVCICGYEKEGFRVVWENYDGTVLKTLELENIESIPSYDGEMPTREKDAQYTYAFSGWREKTTTNRVVYTAQYSTTINKYTVTWKNHDGTVLETDTEVPYGTIPTYNGNTPVKEKDAQYTYSFNSWDKTISAVVGHITYIAKFSNTVNKYTITWKNYDGTVLKTDSVAYGSKPSYTGTTPTKQGDEQYGYLFEGWSPIVVNVVGDAVYTAQFTSSLNKYTVTWKNYDGTVLETDNNVAYGTVPTYNGSMPNKPYDSLNEYEFEGWSPKIEGITGNTIYTALFSINDATTFIVKYDANGGTRAPSFQTKSKGQSIALSSTIPTNGEHVFIGWECAYDGNTYKSGNAFNVDANVTLYAVWGHGCETCGATGLLSKNYTCSSCGGDGKKDGFYYTKCSHCDGYGSIYYEPFPCLVCYGENSNCSNCGGKGYVGDKVDSCVTCNGSGQMKIAYSSCSSCSSSGIITEKYTCINCNGEANIKNLTQSYSLTLKNGTSTFATKTVYYGDSFKLNIPTKTGYTFVGWFDAQENGKQYTDRDGVSLKVWDENNNKNLYAQWIKNYNITYNLDDGSANNPTVYNIETPTFTLNNPTKMGYIFIGWTGSNGDKLDLDTVISTENTGDLHFIANWSVNQYTLSFVAQNGQSFDSITQDYGTMLALPKPTWSEHSFVGWFDETLTIEFTSERMPAENVTLYAKWIDYEVFLCVDNLTGLSVNDDLNDGLSYGITAIDTDNNPVSVKAQLISGSQTAGTCITVRFVATGLYGVYATQMISDIKVYGMPAITYNTEKDYMNESDSLVASLFTAMATDTFGESLFLNVSIKETGYKSGDTITIILSATDVVGNTTVVEIDSVKYYGTPTIVRNESVTEMKISDTISNEFFGVSAADSFGEVLTVNTVLYSGSFVGGNTITIKSSVTDSKGNSAYITFNVKVYGLPTITSAVKTNFKEGEEINLSTLGIIAKDSFGNALENVTLSLTDGTNAAGNILTYLVTATDHLGNVNTKTFSVKIYGTPTITYDTNKTAIKATDRISASLLSATAKDSFGYDLTVTATLESGEIKGGYCITIKLSTIDNVGNTYSIVTGEIRVYAQEDIVLTYNSALSNNIKKTSCGEEFNAIATDSFGGECLINVVPASGYSLVGGNTINLYLVATDKSGNAYTSDIIIEKNVYDTPTLSYTREYNYIMPNDNPYLLFAVKDSFGSDRLFDIEIISGSLQELGTIIYRITAEDKMGNKLDCEYELEVIEYDTNGFLIYDDGGVATLIDYLSQEELVIPNGVQVIIDDLFKDDDIIKFVKLPDSVLSIGKEAFSGCVNLNEIILSNNITTINEKLFFNCVNLVNITIPDGVNRINSSAFSGCSSLENITLPFIGGSVENNVDSCETLFGYIFGTAIYTGGSAVKQYYSDKEFVTYYVPAVLKKVTITGGSLHYGAFYNCSSLTTIILPSNVSIINTKAFYNCKALTSIEIPNSVTNIGDYAFCNCNSLTFLKIPELVTNIGTGAFRECRNLTRLIYNSINCTISSSGSGVFAHAGKDSTGIMVTIGKNVKIIPAYFFWTSDPYYQQPKIGTVEFEEKSECVSIGRYSFYWCGIDYILIPTSVLEIEYGAFYNNLSFRGLTIEYSGTMTQWTQITLGYQWSGNKWNEGRYVYCTDGSIYYDKDGNKK